jgi:thymidine phosphorylase
MPWPSRPSCRVRHDCSFWEVSGQSKRHPQCEKGGALPRSVVSEFAESPTEEAMRRLSEHFAEGQGTVDEIGRLAITLAASGEQVRSSGDGFVDVASTGGPGSLTTLLAPLFIRSLGGRVSKIAVPGRPAGGLDVLGSLAGYRAYVGLEDAGHILARCGYLHVGAGDVFCPLDARLFEWRQRNGFQAVADLAIASLLSKKVAAGVSRAVLDVRVGRYGNFGASRTAARRNSMRFVAAAASIGIEGVCGIGNSSLAQPFVGRGEAARALAVVLMGEATGQLASHVDNCLELARIAVDESTQPTELASLLDSSRRSHADMLTAHGSCTVEFHGRVHENASAHRRIVVAPKSGHLQFDLAMIREVIVKRNRVASATSSFPDECGLVTLVGDGEYVGAGQPVVAVRSSPDDLTIAAEVAESISFGRPSDPEDGIAMEVFRG